MGKTRAHHVRRSLSLRLQYEWNGRQQQHARTYYDAYAREQNQNIIAVVINRPFIRWSPRDVFSRRRAMVVYHRSRSLSVCRSVGRSGCRSVGRSASLSVGLPARRTSVESTGDTLQSSVSGECCRRRPSLFRRRAARSLRGETLEAILGGVVRGNTGTCSPAPLPLILPSKQTPPFFFFFFQVKYTTRRRTRGIYYYCNYVQIYILYVSYFVQKLLLQYLTCCVLYMYNADLRIIYTMCTMMQGKLPIARHGHFT